MEDSFFKVIPKKKDKKSMDAAKYAESLLNSMFDIEAAKKLYRKIYEDEVLFGKVWTKDEIEEAFLKLKLF